MSTRRHWHSISNEAIIQSTLLRQAKWCIFFAVVKRVQPAYHRVIKAIERRITSQLSKVARGCEPEYARLRLKFATVLLAPELAVVAEAALPYSSVNQV